MNRPYLHTPRLVIGTILFLFVCLAASLPLSQKAANSAAAGVAPSSSMSALQGDRVALKLYYSDSRKDNFTTATGEGERDAKNSGYRYVRVEGYLLSSQQAGTVPLKLYYSDSRRDNFTTATAEGERDARAAGYRYVRTEGYLYPDERQGTVPLRLFYSDARGDNYTTATGQGEDSAKAAGYRYVRTEGYLFQDEGGGGSGGGGGGGGGASGDYVGCFGDESGKDLNGYHWKDEKYMTVGRCVESCRARGFSYAGTQYGWNCFCGDSPGKYGKLPEFRCDESPCTGDSKQKCGGTNANSVYRVGG